MKRSGAFASLVSVLAALALSATLVGCTDADDLNNGNYTLKLVPEATNLGGVDYQCITMDFGLVRLVPLDPDAADALGASPQIAILPEGRSLVNLQPDRVCPDFPTQTLPDIPLASGRYVFDRLSFGLIYLDDGVFPLDCFAEVNYLEFADSPIIEIEGSGANTVRISIDIEAVAEDALNTFCSNFFTDPLSFVTIEAI